MTEKFLNDIRDKNIAIVGLGGIGGYLASYIARLNPKSLLLIDGDFFTKGNMNRQLFCTDKTLNLYKADCVKEYIVHTTCAQVCAINQYLNEENLYILKDCDIIMDATDNFEARKLMQKACVKYQIPIVHGAINKLFGQVAVIRPDDKLMDKFNTTGRFEKTGQTLSFVPANIASFQVSEMLKYFSGTNPLNCGELLIIDLLNNDTRIINL